MKKYEVLSPTCYKNFSCKGGNCRTTCCGGWNIDLTKDEYKKTKKKKENLEQFIKAVQKSDDSKKIYRVILNENGECPFLTEERLCGLQSEFGANILSNTCSQFPRVYHKYFDQIEVALSLGCERTLELLLEGNEKLSFCKYVKNISEKQRYRSRVDEAQRRKYPVFKYYYEIQDLCISLLQAEDVSLEDRMLLLGIALKHIDQLVKEGQVDKIPLYIEDYFVQLETVDITNELGTISVENIQIFYNYLMRAEDYIPGAGKLYIQLIDKAFKNLQATVETKPLENGQREETLHCSEELYQKSKKNLERLLKGKEYFLENMMVAWLLYYQIPFDHMENGIWNNYTYFVWAYGMLKFILTASLDENSTEEDLIDCCVIMFRTLGHNQEVYNEVLQQFAKYENDSVAHMAIFLKA